MNCEQFSEFIIDYLDGVLPPAQREAFEAKLAECELCRAFLETYQRTVVMEQRCIDCDGPEGALPEDVPDDLVDAILHACKGCDEQKPAGDG